MELSRLGIANMVSASFKLFVPIGCIGLSCFLWLKLPVKALDNEVSVPFQPTNFS